MATRIAARYISRRLCSSGKVLSDKEKAAGNIVCIKKMEEDLDKLAREGPSKPSETPAGSAKPSGDSSPGRPFLAGAALISLKLDELYWQHVPVFSGIILGGIGAEFLVQPKDKPALVAFCAFLFAVAGVHTVKRMDSKKKMEEAEE